MKKTIILTMLLLSIFLFGGCNQNKLSQDEIKQLYMEAHVNTKKDARMHYEVLMETKIKYGSETMTVLTVYDIKIVPDENGKELFQINFTITADELKESFSYYYDGEKYYLTAFGETSEVDAAEAGQDLDVLNLEKYLIFEPDSMLNLTSKKTGENRLIQFDLDSSELTARMIRELDYYVQEFITLETKYEAFQSHILINSDNEVIQNGLYLKYTSILSEEKITVSYRYVFEIKDKGDSVVLDFMKNE